MISQRDNLYAKSKLYSNIFPRNLKTTQQTYMHPNVELVSVQLEILTRKLGRLVLFNKEKGCLKRTYKQVLVQKANFIWHIQNKKNYETDNRRKKKNYIYIYMEEIHQHTSWYIWNQIWHDKYDNGENCYPTNTVDFWIGLHKVP